MERDPTQVTLLAALLVLEMRVEHKDGDMWLLKADGPPPTLPLNLSEIARKIP